ncbi:hypothetical protein cyc_04194 [Cyclospora cayetanensis]|uniref:Uncharacterized protein n=1 Tax=Cyclospora cayetanensis TaxID=88456 RepID=A0A1D3CRX8_9EIME|nr:hypothetical protein cyc_04194 [Cyclospora cayetanensis]
MQSLLILMLQITAAATAVVAAAACTPASRLDPPLRQPETAVLRHQRQQLPLLAKWKTKSTRQLPTLAVEAVATDRGRLWYQQDASTHGRSEASGSLQGGEAEQHPSRGIWLRSPDLREHFVHHEQQALLIGAATDAVGIVTAAAETAAEEEIAAAAAAVMPSHAELSGLNVDGETASRKGSPAESPRESSVATAAFPVFVDSDAKQGSTDQQAGNAHPALQQLKGPASPDGGGHLALGSQQRGSLPQQLHPQQSAVQQDSRKRKLQHVVNPPGNKRAQCDWFVPPADSSRPLQTTPAAAGAADNEAGAADEQAAIVLSSEAQPSSSAAAAELHVPPPPPGVAAVAAVANPCLPTKDGALWEVLQLSSRAGLDNRLLQQLMLPLRLWLSQVFRRLGVTEDLLRRGLTEQQLLLLRRTDVAANRLLLRAVQRRAAIACCTSRSRSTSLENEALAAAAGEMLCSARVLLESAAAAAAAVSEDLLRQRQQQALERRLSLPLGRRDLATAVLSGSLLRCGSCRRWGDRGPLCPSGGGPRRGPPRCERHRSPSLLQRRRRVEAAAAAAGRMHGEEKPLCCSVCACCAATRGKAPQPPSGGDIPRARFPPDQQQFETSRFWQWLLRHKDALTGAEFGGVCFGLSLQGHLQQLRSADWPAAATLALAAPVSGGFVSSICLPPPS